MKKILFTLILGILLIGIVSASLDSLGTFEKDEHIRIKQVCSDATYINISSITYPNSTIAVSNIEMISSGSGEFYYFFNDTEVLGRYDVQGISDGCSATSNTFSTYFEVTNNGKQMDTGESILYSLFILILFGISVVIFYSILALPSDNIEGENGEIMAIVKLKYLRIVLIALEYLMGVIILNLINGILVNFGNLSMFANIAGFLFEVLIRLSIPFVVFIIAWIVYNAIKDTNLKKVLNTIYNPLGNTIR